MTIAFSSVFNTVGRVGRVLYLMDGHQAALPAALEDLYNNFDGSNDRDIIAEAISLYQPILNNVTAAMPRLQATAQSYLLRTVADDKPSAANTLADAVAELDRQMRAGSQSVAACAVTCNTTVFTPQAGTGTVVVTTKRGDGLVQENTVSEVARLACVSDAYGGGATSGAESFRFVGGAVSPDVWRYDWPAGTGADVAVSAYRPADGLGENTGFDTFETVANVPDDWTIAVGTAGTNVLEETSVVYDSDGASVKIVGGATQVSLTQDIAADLAGVTSYGVVLWVRVATVPAAGVLTIDLVDGSNTVVADAQGTNNTFTRTLSTLVNNTWTLVTGVFRTPRAVPAVCHLRLRLSTAMSAGSDLYIDRLSVAPTTFPDPAGCGVSLHGGNVGFAAGDGWLVTTTNDRASATYAATFQSLFARLFDTPALGILLPSSGSPTQADTLITA